jgi:hypothetical protein
MGQTTKIGVVENNGRWSRNRHILFSSIRDDMAADDSARSEPANVNVLRANAAKQNAQVKYADLRRNVPSTARFLCVASLEIGLN